MNESKETFTIVKRLNGRLHVSTPDPHIDPRRLFEIGQWARESVDMPIGRSLTVGVTDTSKPLYESLRGSFAGVEIGLSERQLLKRRASRSEPLKRMSWIVDSISVPGLRRTLTKLVVDEQGEIFKLYAQGKANTARRREHEAWICMTRYIVKYPLSALVLVLIKKFHIGG